MQQISGNLRILLESSIFRINSERISDGIWTTGMCQNILLQVSPFYNHLLSGIIFDTDRTLIGPTDKEGGEDRKYLLICLLRETINPFCVKWERKFFRRNGKSRLYSRKKYRYGMQSDFIMIQEVIDGLCETLKPETEPEEKKGDEKKPKNGYN